MSECNCEHWQTCEQCRPQGVCARDRRIRCLQYQAADLLIEVQDDLITKAQSTAIMAVVGMIACAVIAIYFIVHASQLEADCGISNQQVEAQKGEEEV